MNNIYKYLLLFVFIILFQQPGTSQKVIFMLRHAERVAYDNSDNDLSEAGHARAKTLANLLKNAGVTVIYTSTMKRAINTAKPLADTLKIMPAQVGGVDSAYAMDMLSRMSKLTDEDVVLIIGHINTFIPLMRMMGYKDEIKMGDFEHDDLFVVYPKEKGKPVVIRLNY